MTLKNFLLINSNKYPTREAVTFEDARTTFSMLDYQVNRFARALLDLRVKRGDNVAVLSLDCIELIETFFGIWKLGAVLVPLNIRMSPGELEFVLDHSDASVIVFLEDFEETV